MHRDVNNTWTANTLQRGETDAIRQRVLAEPTYLRERDYVGATPLLNAIAFDNVELVRFMLSRDADPNVDVDDGYTCLLTAIESEAQPSIAVVAELIQGGADVHARGINGWSPLHMASARGHVEKAQLLLEAGAEANQRKEIDGLETPLMEAAFTGQPSTIRLLLANGADALMRNTDGHTPLDIAQKAAQGPDPDVVRCLQDETMQVDPATLFKGMDLPEDQLEMMKQTIRDTDMAQGYIDSSKELVETGEHAEAIRILSEHTPNTSARLLHWWGRVVNRLTFSA